MPRTKRSKPHTYALSPAALIIVGAALALTGCSSSSTDNPTQRGTASPSPAATAGLPTQQQSTADSAAMIIDVRTPQEFAAGHLSGAVNLDVNDPSFDARMAQLDRTGTYFVYCRSGNRSAQAVNRMRDAGFVDSYDYGSVEEAASTLNVDIVR